MTNPTDSQDKLDELEDDIILGYTAHIYDNDYKYHYPDLTSNQKWEKAAEQAKQAIKQLILNENTRAIQAYIKPHLDYCQEVNGRRSCKNCQLQELSQSIGDK